jgi:lysophospholipase L1-like esterase
MKKLALSAVAVVVTLLLAEVVLRLTGIGPLKPGLVLDKNTAARVASGVMVTDPVLLWREAKDLLNYDRPDRFVQPGEPAPPRTAKPRVLCVGDSCTRLTDDGVPYSLALESLLGSQTIEVFNASLPGYTTYQGRAWLHHGLLDLRPDVVVIYFGWNDHWRSTGIADSELARLMRPARPRLLNLLVKPHTPHPLRVPPAEYSANLAAMLADIRAAGAKPLLILAPHHLTAEAQARLRENGNVLPGDDPTALHESYLALTREAAAAAGAEVVDAAAVFATLDAWPEILMRDGIHPTQIGHLILASLLSEHLASLVPALPATGLGDPSLAWKMLAQVRREQGHWAEALAAAGRAAAASPGQPGPRLSWAWSLATCPVDSLRDGNAALAVLAALPADVSATADAQEARAAAYAAAGRYDEAVAAAEATLRALGAGPAAISGEPPRVTAIRHRLEGYQRRELRL